MTDATWLRAEIDRLDRNQAELQKLMVEKFARSRKFNRDPWIIVIGAIVAALVFRLPEILHAFGVGH